MINWTTIDNPEAILEVNEPFILKMGKRTFVKCIPENSGVKVKLIDLVRATMRLPKDVINQVII